MYGDVRRVCMTRKFLLQLSTDTHDFEKILKRSYEIHACRPHVCFKFKLSCTIYNINMIEKGPERLVTRLIQCINACYITCVCTQWICEMSTSHTERHGKITSFAIRVLRTKAISRNQIFVGQRMPGLINYSKQRFTVITLCSAFLQRVCI